MISLRKFSRPKISSSSSYSGSATPVVDVEVERAGPFSSRWASPSRGGDEAEEVVEAVPVGGLLQKFGPVAPAFEAGAIAVAVRNSPHRPFRL